MTTIRMTSQMDTGTPHSMTVVGGTRSLDRQPWPALPGGGFPAHAAWHPISMKGVDRALQTALAGGSLAFGAWGLFRPASLARLMGASPREARVLGVRDTIVGAGIALAPGPLPYVTRAASDVSDLVRFGRARPAVGVGAAMFALLALEAGRRAR